MNGHGTGLNSLNEEIKEELTVAATETRKVCLSSTTTSLLLSYVLLPRPQNSPSSWTESTMVYLGRMAVPFLLNQMC